MKGANIPEADVVEQVLVTGNVDTGLGMRLELHFLNALLQPVGAARGMYVPLDVRPLDGDLVRLNVKRRDQRRHCELDHQRQRHNAGEQPPSCAHQAGRDHAGDDRHPLQRQRDLLIHVIHSGHEAVVVPNHLVASKKVPHCQREKKNCAGAAQEFRLQSACQSKHGRIDFAALAQVRKRVAELPAASGQPIDQRGPDGYRKQESTQLGVERQVEKEEGEGRSEYRIAPGGSFHRQSARADEAHRGPVIERGSGQHKAQQQQRHRRKLGVSGIVAQGDGGELHSTRVCDPQHQERDQCRRHLRRQTVPQHIQPGLYLAHLLPPLVFDDVSGNGACAEEKNQSNDQERYPAHVASPA